MTLTTEMLTFLDAKEGDMHFVFRGDDGSLRTTPHDPMVPAALAAAEIAAAYAFRVSKAHAFVDGNRRTALVTALTVLRLNGFSLRPIPSRASVQRKTWRLIRLLRPTSPSRFQQI